MRAANIVNNLVADVWEVPDLNCYGDLYNLVESPINVSVGWGYVDNEFIAPIPSPEKIQAQNKETATSLLQSTDWTCTVDITNPQYSNPYLANQSDFLAYRSTIRAIAVNPPTTPVTFPAQPQEVWSNV
jgi:hypothetical protein